MSKRCVYIILTETGSWINKFIKFYTGAPYNHVSISMDLHLNEMYSFGRKHLYVPVWGGFVQENVNQGMFKHFPETRCAILKLKVSEEEHCRISSLLQHFEQNKELYRYNLIGLFGIMLDLPLAMKNAYFCSQFVAELLKKSEVPLWDVKTSLVVPNDFLQHPDLQLVYEGKLHEYPLLMKESIV
ncbi:hypothetical protein G4V62_08905 [Bacillaceae bacterium SIJ1]|nr:hypothetical protein [Litoribacterium kuwaitense]